MLNKVFVAYLILFLAMGQTPEQRKLTTQDNHPRNLVGLNSNPSTNNNGNPEVIPPSTTNPGNTNPGNVSPQDQYINWFSQYYNRYGFTREEYQFRKTLFVKHYNQIVTHNSDPTVTFQMGVNQFTGLTQAEFQQYSLGQQAQPNSTIVDSSPPPQTRFDPDGLFILNNQNTAPSTPAPSTPGPNTPGGIIPQRLLQQVPFNFVEWDWRGVKGALSPVRDQGNCGACYSFAAVAAVESAYMIAQGYYNVDLSEQQIVDCTSRYGNRGCIGGYKDRSLRYVQSNGLVSERAYPYKSKKGDTCIYQDGNYKVKNVQIIEGCKNMRKAVRKAPVAVSVSISGWNGWKNFKNGVIQCPENSKVDHAVLLVGYTPQLHYIIKNSWGTSWGEKGYTKIDALKNCNICQKPGVQVTL